MVTTGFIYNFGQTVLDFSKSVPKKNKEEAKDPEENQIIEDYEGDCEQCEIDKPQRICEVCGI